MYKKTLTVILFLASLSIGSTRAAEHADTLFLPVERLFERGVKYNLQLQADALETAMAHERTKTARATGRICGTAGCVSTRIIRPYAS